MAIFDLIANSNYVFLELNSEVVGNVAITEYPATGVAKLRDGMVQADNMEAYTSNALLYIRPSEPFLADLGGNLVGHGVRIANATGSPTDYRIIGQIEGKDYDTGQVDFYKVTLKPESLSVWEQGLPLE